mgnify:CR=1 FL=1
MDLPDIDARSKTTCLLLIENERNQELLADQLSNKFAIQTGADNPFTDPSFDLCIIDPPSLSDYQIQIQETKKTAEPVFLPILLLAGQRSPDGFSESVWTVVDEVLQRPVAKAELNTRIKNLLGRRRLSVALAQQKARSDQRFEALFQSTPDPVVVVTPDGTITEVNEAFSQIFGIESEEIQERPITDLDLPQSETVDRVLLRIADDKPSSTTVEWELDEETPLVTEVNTDVVTGFGGATERIGIFRDITERVERGRELEQQNERLKEFAGTVAHDLRNPLNVAQTRIQLAQETGDDKHFDAVKAAQERMEQMIEQLLSLAKQGQNVLDPDDLLLEDVINQAWSHVQTANASFQVDIDNSVVITADESRLRELLENLFRNSIEHGGEAVTIRVGDLPNGAGFYVEDDGPGISPEHRSDVIQSGFTETENGTGFGLSIVKQIVEGHDWQLSITESNEGGARFEITTAEG